MYNYSMMPLNMAHFDEICADIKEQYKRGVTTCPLFIMTLVPEGDPVWDKVGPMCEKYAKFRDELAKDGVPSGVLIQASLGHGYDINLAPFDRVVKVENGQAKNAYCPLGKDFLAHFKQVVKRIAKERPQAIMLDDDFRIMAGNGGGCACPLHMAEFEKRTGKKWTQADIFEHMKTHPKDDPLTVAFYDMQTDSLVEAAKIFREGIDEVDPKIQGLNCTSGDYCDSVVYTSKAFCGKGNPSVVRVPCGTYAPISVREFSDVICRTATCSAKLKNHGVDIILAETDTIPFNRYGKNARYLHSHYTSVILEGVKGAKHWLTRTTAWEPKSGKAFRDILAEHKDFYEKLANYSDGIKWQGASSAFVVQEYYNPHSKLAWRNHSNYWVSKCFERLGLPFYFSTPDSGAEVIFLEDDIVGDITDNEIKVMFEGSVFMTSEAAANLIKRGYGDLLGVEVKEWEGMLAKGEYFEFDKTASCTAQKNRKMLVPINDKVEVLSYSHRPISGEFKPLSPAVTVLERGDGRLSVVYAGTPDAEHTYTEGFSFLNESRKRQFVELLSRAGALPIYYEGDEEVLLRAGRIKDGRLLAAFINLGYDPLFELDIVTDFVPKEISYLAPDGSEIKLDFVLGTDGKVKVMTELLPMYPLVLLIK